MRQPPSCWEPGAEGPTTPLRTEKGSLPLAGFSPPGLDRRVSGPDTGSFFRPRTKAGDNHSLPSGNPTGERTTGLFSSVCFGPAAVSAIFKWLQLDRPHPPPELPQPRKLGDRNFGRPLLLTVLKILCPTGAKPSPWPGIRPSADSPFHRRPGSTWTLLIFLLPFLLGLTQKGQLTCDTARLQAYPQRFLETKALLKK